MNIAKDDSGIITYYYKRYSSLLIIIYLSAHKLFLEKLNACNSLDYDFASLSIKICSLPKFNHNPPDLAVKSTYLFISQELNNRRLRFTILRFYARTQQ